MKPDKKSFVTSALAVSRTCSAIGRFRGFLPRNFIVTVQVLRAASFCFVFIVFIFLVMMSLCRILHSLIGYVVYGDRGVFPL